MHDFFLSISHKAFSGTLLVEEALQMYKEILLLTNREIPGVVKEVPHQIVTHHVLVVVVLAKKYLLKYPSEHLQFRVARLLNQWREPTDLIKPSKTEAYLPFRVQEVIVVYRLTEFLPRERMPIREIEVLRSGNERHRYVTLDFSEIIFLLLLMFILPNFLSCDFFFVL